MRILITGATGFIGSSLVRALSDSKYQLFLASRSPNKYIFQDNINLYHEVNWGSQEELNALCQDIDLILHAAGVNAHDSEKDPENAKFFNGTLTSNLIDSAIKSEVKRFIYFSTAHVYKSPLVGTITENCHPRNSHPYATSHILGEQAVINATNSSLIDGLVLRVSNVFGIPSIPNRNCWNLFINNVCRQAAKEGKLVIKGNPLQERDFISMRDLCSIVVQLINFNDLSYPDTVLNIGSGKSSTLKDMSLIIKKEYQELFGSNLDLLHSQDEGYKEPEKLFYMSRLLDCFNIQTNDSSLNEIRHLLQFCKDEFAK